MKRYIVVILSFILLLSIATIARASDTIRLFMNGNEIYTDVSPQIIDGRTMVPIRAVSEALGAEVNWNEYTYSVDISLSTADINEYNKFVADYNNKMSELKDSLKIPMSDESSAYIALQKGSMAYANLINQAMLIHPPSDKAEEHNQRLKKLIYKKTGADLLIRSVEEKTKGNMEESYILMFEAAKYIT